MRQDDSRINKWLFVEKNTLGFQASPRAVGAAQGRGQARPRTGQGKRVLCVRYGDEYWGWLDRRGKGWIVKDIECIRWVMKIPSFFLLLGRQ